MAENIEHRTLLSCLSSLTNTLQHNLSLSSKFLEKGLVTEEVHGWQLTATAVSNHDKAARLLACVTDSVKGSSQLYHVFVDILKEEQYFKEVVENIFSEHKALQESCLREEQKTKDGCSIVAAGDQTNDDGIAKEVADSLEEQFEDIREKLLTELIKECSLSPEDLVDSLTRLPIALRAEYQKFVSEKVDRLQKADSIKKVFHHINPLLTFMDYTLLEHLIKKHGSKQLKAEMAAYVVSVKAFLGQTTIGQLADYWPSLPDIPPHFEKLKVTIKGDPKAITLQELNNLRKKICCEISLADSVLVLIGVALHNSYSAIWIVPSMYVPQLKTILGSLRSLKEFYNKEGIMSVTLGKTRVFTCTVAVSLQNSDPSQEPETICKTVLTLDINLYSSNAAWLGLTVYGKSSTDKKAGDMGIYIKSITPGGAAAIDGRLQKNDQILHVNRKNLTGKSNKEALDILRKALSSTYKNDPKIRLVVARTVNSGGRPPMAVLGERPEESVFCGSVYGAWMDRLHEYDIQESGETNDILGDVIQNQGSQALSPVTSCDGDHVGSAGGEGSEEDEEELEDSEYESIYGSIYIVDLHKGEEPLGVYLTHHTSPDGVDLGVFIERMDENGFAFKSGEMHCNDRILACNGVDFTKEYTAERVKEIFYSMAQEPLLRVAISRGISLPEGDPGGCRDGEGHVPTDVGGVQDDSEARRERGVGVSMVTLAASSVGGVDVVGGQAKDGGRRGESATKPPGSPRISNQAAPITLANTRQISIKCTIDLKKGLGGLGIELSTLDVGNKNHLIHIKLIRSGGAAFQDGRLKLGDRLLSVNGVDIQGMQPLEVVRLLREAQGRVSLVVSRQEAVEEQEQDTDHVIGDESAEESLLASEKDTSLRESGTPSDEVLSQLVKEIDLSVEASPHPPKVVDPPGPVLTQSPKESHTHGEEASPLSLQQITSTAATEMEYDFVEQPPKEFFCPVTFELLLSPHLTFCCGNHISETAVKILKRENKPCPICKEPELATVLDKFHRRKVREIRVHCPHKAGGCGWVGEVGELLQSHMDSCLKRHDTSSSDTASLPVESH